MGAARKAYSARLIAAFLREEDRLLTYLRWSTGVGIAFFLVYPAANWLASRSPSPLHLYLPLELSVPLVPQLIWVYLSMYALFVVPLVVLPTAQMPMLGRQLVAGTLASGVLFVLFPAELGFVRVLPDNPFYASLYAAMFSLDRPHNLVPSLHLVFSAAICLACADAATPAVRMVLIAWLAAISISTMLVHQHHLLDVAAAFILVYPLRKRFRGNHA